MPLRPDPSVPTSSGPRRAFWRIVATIGVWTVPALLAAGQLALAQALQGRPVDLARILGGQLATWYLWVPLTPIAWRLSRRFPLGLSEWRRSAVVHGVAGLGVVALYQLAYAPLLVVTESLPLTAAHLRRALATSLSFGLTTQYLVYWGIVGVAHAVDYAHRLAARERRTGQLEAQLARAQLDALRMRLHPHFLFNTLHTVGGLVRDGRRDAAVTTLSRLGTLLRRALAHSDRQYVPLHEELETLEAYLEIESQRFGERLQVEIVADSDIVDASIPALLLQPLVENALRHGIARRAGAGRVAVRATGGEGRLRVVVEDDGAGVTGDSLEGSGLGLRATLERLRAGYGDAGRFEVRRREPHGTRVSVEIPLRLIEAE